MLGRGTATSGGEPTVMARIAFPRLPTPGVPRIEAPRLEGIVPLADGHRAGIAEYGDPNGPLVLWFHGTPGGRRQIPPVGRIAAADIALDMEVEPATFVAVQRKDAGL